MSVGHVRAVPGTGGWHCGGGFGAVWEQVLSCVTGIVVYIE